MIAIDTNILVRYLTEDDEIQSEKVSKLFNKYSGKNNSIYINDIVICELIWVLSRGYKYSKEQIIEVLTTILSTSEFSFNNTQILWLCINDFKDSKADFSDILIARQNALQGCKETFTFDTDAATLSNFTLLD